MLKTFKTFLVLALMVSFTAFLSGNTVLAGTELDLAGFHNGEAVKLGNTMVERAEKRDLIGMIKYGIDAITQAEDAIVHAFKEGRSQLENINYHIEDSTVRRARDEYKATEGVGKYVNELTEGIWRLQAAVNSAKRGEEQVAWFYAEKGMVFLKNCQKDLKGMGAKELQQVPNDYDLTAVGAEVSY